MTIPTLPEYVFPSKPVPQITPFTYRDGVTMLKKLDGIVRYINRELVPFVNENYSELADAFEEQVNLLIEQVNAAIEMVINDSVDVQDPVVYALLNDLDSLTGGRALELYGDGVNIDAFGAIGDGIADDTDAINAAIDSIGNEEIAGVLRFTPGKTYKTNGNHKVRRKRIIADGAKIVHTGDNVLFDFNSTTDWFVMTPMGITGAEIVGPTGAVNSVAVRLGNSWGSYTENLTITGYTTGIGIQLYNDFSATRGGQRWTEGARLSGGRLETFIGVQFKNNSGTESFGYTNVDGLAIAVPANGTAFDLSGSTIQPVELYNSRIHATVWLNGNGGTVLKYVQGCRGFGNKFEVHGETGSAVTNVSSLTSIRGDYGEFNGDGVFHVTSGFVQASVKPGNVLTNGAKVKIIPASAVEMSSDIIGAVDLQPAFPVGQYNVDNPHLGSIGFIEAAGVATPYTASYVGSHAFRAFQLAVGEQLNQAIEVFRVDNTGNLLIGRGVPRKLSQGSSTLANASGSDGDVHFANDGTYSRVSGRWRKIRNGVGMRSPFVGGRYHQPVISATSTAAVALDNLRLMAIEVAENATLTEIGCEITAVGGAGSTIRFGIYRLNPDYTTELLVDAGTVVGTATGYVSKPISVPVGAGETILVGCVNQGGTPPTVRSGTGSNPLFGSTVATTMTGNPIICASVSGISGALPSSASISGGASYAALCIVKA